MLLCYSKLDEKYQHECYARQVIIFQLLKLSIFYHKCLFHSSTDHHVMVAISASTTSHLFIKDPWRFIYGWQCYSPKFGVCSCSRTACGGHVVALIILLTFPPCADPMIVQAAIHDSRMPLQIQVGVTTST